MRYGWWFRSRPNEVLRVKLEENETHFDAFQPELEDLGAMYQLMIPYTDHTEQWLRLTSHIDMEALGEYILHAGASISTATSLVEESMALREILRRKQPDIKLDELPDQELRYTIVQRHAASDGVGLSLTDKYLDRSWQMEELFGHDKELLLAEFEISFAHFIVIGNLCSYTQWLSLLLLILVCKTFFQHNGQLLRDLTAVLSRQLHHFPEEYITSVVEPKEFHNILLQLRDVLSTNASWPDVQLLCQKKFGCEFSDGQFDKDNFEVYDLDGHDSDDENAPAIIM